MRLVFDLDGTLVSTWYAHLEAYRAAGIEPPPCARWQTAGEWKCPATVHHRKTMLFPKLLREHGKLLSAATLYRSARGPVLTGCSAASVAAIVECWPEVFNGRLIVHGLTLNDKIKFLNNRGPGVYFEDQEHVASAIRRSTRWQVVNVSGL